MTREEGESSPGPGVPAPIPPARPELGEIKINNELLATVACYAALETPGVVWITGRRSPEEIPNRKEVDRGVSASVRGDGKAASFQLEVNVEYGYDIYETMRQAQRAVKNAIEHMTGFGVAQVDIAVRGVVPRSPEAETRKD